MKEDDTQKPSGLPDIPLPPVPADGQIVAAPIPTTKRGCYERSIAEGERELYQMAANRNSLDLMIRKKKFEIEAMVVALDNLPPEEKDADEGQLLMFSDPQQAPSQEAPLTKGPKGPRHQKSKSANR